MSAGRPHATLGPSAVWSGLREAQRTLTRALGLTEDRATKEAITRSQREVRAAIARARAVLQHVDLLEAEQPPLFPPE